MFSNQLDIFNVERVQINEISITLTVEISISLSIIHSYNFFNFNAISILRIVQTQNNIKRGEIVQNMFYVCTRKNIYFLLGFNNVLKLCIARTRTLRT